MTIVGMDGSVKRINKASYKVNSQSSNNSYNVNVTEIGWNCSCPDHIYRGASISMQQKFRLLFARKLKVEIRKIEPVQINSCIFCSSFNIAKYGLRQNRYGNLQKYTCRDYSHYFTINWGFERMHTTPQMITSQIQLYFTGESADNHMTSN